MYWTLELASKLEDAPWPATKEELIDYAVRSGAPWRCWKTCRRSKTKAIFTNPSKIFGPTTRRKTTSSLMRKSINNS